MQHLNQSEIAAYSTKIGGLHSNRMLLSLQSLAFVIMFRLCTTRAYCDKTAEAGITRFTREAAQCLEFLHHKFDDDF